MTYVPSPPPQNWEALYRELHRIAMAMRNLDVDTGLGNVNAYGAVTIAANDIYTLTMTGNAGVESYTVHWGDGTTTEHTADGSIQYSFLEAQDNAVVVVDALGTDGVTYEGVAAWPIVDVTATATESLVKSYVSAVIQSDIEIERISPAEVFGHDGKIEEIPENCVPYCGYLVCDSFMRKLDTATSSFDDASWTADANVTLTPQSPGYLYSISDTSARSLNSSQTTGGFSYIGLNFLAVLDIEPLVDTSINIAIRNPLETVTLYQASLSMLAADGRQTYAIPLSVVLTSWSGNVMLNLYDDSGGIGDRFILYAIDIQDVTDRDEQLVPRPMTSYGEGETFNSGVDGIQFIANDYSNSTVDGSYIVDYQEGNALTGYLAWQPPVENLAVGDHNWGSGAQTVTLSETGKYTISLKGDANVTVAADTAVGTGWDDVTEDAPITIDITTIGDITLTLNIGSFEQSFKRDLLQVERGPINTMIHPPGSSPGRTRNALAIGYTGSNISTNSGLIVTKYSLDHDPDLIGYGDGILTYDALENASVFEPEDDSEIFIEGTAPFDAGDVVVSAVCWNDFWGSMRNAYSINGGAFVTDDVTQEYDEDYETVGFNDYFISPDFPMRIYGIWVYSTNPGLNWVADQTW